HSVAGAGIALHKRAGIEARETVVVQVRLTIERPPDSIIESQARSYTPVMSGIELDVMPTDLPHVGMVWFVCAPDHVRPQHVRNVVSGGHPVDASRIVVSVIRQCA